MRYARLLVVWRGTEKINAKLFNKRRDSAVVRAPTPHQWGPVRFPDPASYVGWVCCWFSSLLNNMTFQFDPEIRATGFVIFAVKCHPHQIRLIMIIIIIIIIIIKEWALSITSLWKIATGQKLKPNFLKTLKNFKSDDVSTFTQRHFQVKMNEKKLPEYKCTKQILRE